MAEELGGGVYWKNANRWWDGYHGENVIILDELGKECNKWICNFLKRWADIYPLTLEIKGSHAVAKFTHIIITC